MSVVKVTHMESPIGLLILKARENVLIEIEINPADPEQNDASLPLPAVLTHTRTQLKEYFEGKRKVFSIPYRQEGSPFQKMVWDALKTIPYSDTVSYQYIATACGSRKAVRAVGGANALNKIPIIVPCHRVIGSNGKLTGYAGGLGVKAWLLKHEIRYSDKNPLLLF